MTGREAIRTYWAKVPEYHRDLTFGSQVLHVEGDMGITRWWAEYTSVPRGGRERLDGVFLLEFDHSLCRSLREWWHQGPAG
jgi:SnoaL-like domain